MAFPASASGICARALGAVIAVVLFTAAPITPGSLAPAQAQSRASVSVEFRTALEPYGRWERHARWGEVWIPANRSRDWRPYTVGRWVYTEEWGWYWVEDQEEANWGWVTFHYGRWVSDRELGWVWIASDEWGPGWVQWRHGKEYLGWAPLAPDEIVVEYRERPEVWVFVRVRDFASAPRLARVILPPREYEVYVRETVVVNQTVVLQDRRIAVNPGLPPGIVAAAVGRPLRAYEVRPRILAGTVWIPGAIEVRAQDVRRPNFRAEVTARETQSVIRPADRAAQIQPLGPGEKGRLGDNPPRAARGGAPAPTTGQGPQPQQGQQPLQPRGTEGRGTQEGAQPPQAPADRRGVQQQQQPQGRAGQQQQQQQQGTQGRGAQETPNAQPQPGLGERRGVQQRQPQQGTEGRGTQQQPQQGPDRRGVQQRPPQQGTEGRGAQEQPQRAPERSGVRQQEPQQGTQGRGGAEPQRQGTEGRGPQQQRLQPGTDGRGGAAPQRPPQGTEGRGGGAQPGGAAPQPGRRPGEAR